MAIDALLTCIALYHLVPSSATDPLTQSIFFKTGNDDVIFNDYVILDGTGRTRLSCAIACEASTSGCHAYTFVKGSTVTSSGSCRLYSGFLASGPSSPRIGARTFAKERTSSAWLRQTCTGSSTCAGSLTSCHAGQCLCQPSAYYSNAYDVCVQTCQQSDLGSTFLAYSEMDVEASRYIDSNGYAQDDLSQCQADCVNHNQCHSVIHGVGDSQYDSCWPTLSFTAGQETSYNLPWFLYKRTCV